MAELVAPGAREKNPDRDGRITGGGGSAAGAWWAAYRTEELWAPPP